MKKREPRHGLSKTRIYRIWHGMNVRCSNETRHNYKYYGGVGIIVCERWRKSFLCFYEDMKDGYADNLSLDRKDPNLNYDKNNCRWIEIPEQGKNKRNTQYLTIDGVTKRLIEWGLIAGISDTMIRQRINRDGMPAKDAVFASRQ